MKDTNFYVVHGWMVNRLKLKGTEKDIYAIIYGFTQDGETKFTGSRKYLADFIQTSLPTVDKALKSLVEKGLLTKKETIINQVKFNSYRISLGVVKKLYRGGKESLGGGGKETLHYSKGLYNNSNNKEKGSKDPKKETPKENSFIGSKTTKKDKKYLKLSKKLSEIISTQKNIKHSSLQLKRWLVEFKRLEITNGVSSKRMQEVLDWYAVAVGGEYIPVIESGKSFREKFTKLEDAIKREKTPIQKKKPNNGFRRQDGHVYDRVDGTI